MNCPRQILMAFQTNMIIFHSDIPHNSLWGFSPLHSMPIFLVLFNPCFSLSFNNYSLFGSCFYPLDREMTHDLYHGYVSKAQPYQGMVNVVVLLKTVKEGLPAGKAGKEKKQKEIFYVTNKRISGDPLKIVKLYASRWSVENQGIRDLSQRWLIRTPAGRTLNAITARICLILKLYNAMKIMEMKYGEEWRKNKEEIKAWGERSFIGGQGIIVYTDGYFATFNSRQYKILIETRTRNITQANILKDIKKYLPPKQFKALCEKLSC